jgi:glycosyltransferase involved in cell wall biosynthesis
MQQLTIITTYYNERRFLEEFVADYIKLKSMYPQLRLIIVDDGSQIHPAKNIIEKHPDIELYTILEDMGFNSHGARNLGIEVSSTHWNLLIDVDFVLSSFDFNQISCLDFDNDTTYFLDLNMFIVNKDVFMSCQGYDEEFFNMHYGDRIFLDYIKSKFKYKHLSTKGPNCKRKNWKIIKTDQVTKTVYNNGILFLPSYVDEQKEKVIKMVKERYASEDFDSKPILNFKWEKTF